MKSKPFIFNLISVFLLLVVVSIPLQIILQTELTLINYKILINQISMFNWIIIFTCLITSVYSFYGDAKVITSSLLLLASVILNNYFVFTFSTNMHWSLPVISTALAFLSIFAICSNRNFLYTVKNQNKRWWLIPNRHKKVLPIWIQINEDKCLLARTYDVSTSGAFISSISGIQNFLEKGLSVGNKVRVLIGDKDDIEFQCDASIIRKTQATGIYPSGIGLHFERIPIRERLALNKIISSPSVI